MIDVDYNEIKDLISIDTFNDTSLFAVSVVDLLKYEIIYANQAMKNIMFDMTAQNCWQAIHGQDAPCMWCKAPMLLKNLRPEVHYSQSTVDTGYAVYEHFNEVANRWYQIQEKVVTLQDDRNVLISFALDISLQKEAQSKLIDTHVKLTKQTQALKEAQEKLKEQANRDPLTNLYNRRYFSDISEQIIALAKRTKSPLSLIMIDIDDFKKVNDTYGHNIGDEVIKLLSNEITASIRESDVVARFGGEEFAVIFPNTDGVNAFKLANKLRENIENARYIDGKESIGFTISIGLDEFNLENDATVSDSLNRADKALYNAKATGKNRVSIFKH
jgi:diguanylate cyclase (GGDEF)-like protein